MIIKTPFNGLFRKINSERFDQKNTNADEYDHTSLSTTEKMVSIINGAIPNGRYKDMNRQMKDLSESMDKIESQVFDVPRFMIGKLFILLLLIASIGCGYLFFTGYRLYYYSDHYDRYAIHMMGSAVLVIIINIVIISRLIKDEVFAKRFQKYKEKLSLKSIEYIDDVAGYVACSPKQVRKELKRGISYGAIPQGHFGYENQVFFTSDSSFSMYLINQKKMDKYFEAEIKDRARRNTRDERINDIIRQGEEHIQNIRELNELIKDKGITQKLYRMEKIVTSIFYEVDNNPKYAGGLGLLLDEYLPMVDKLLDQYANLGTAIQTDFSLKQSQKQIEETLDTLNDLFMKILNQFYQQKEKEILESVLSINDIMKAEAELEGTSIQELMKRYS